MPAELVPTEWPRVSVRRAWMHLYNQLGGPAEEHVRRVVGSIDAQARELVTSRRLSDS